MIISWNMEENLIKSKYKIFLALLKSIPIIWSSLIFINTILRTVGISFYILNIFCGISLLPLIFLYLASYVFQFCEYHRMFIHYISIIFLIRVLEFYNIVPVDSILVFISLMIITFIFMVITLYKYLKTKKGGSYGKA